VSRLHAIVREPHHRMADVELTHVQRRPIDPVVARAQHAAYRDALARRGVRVRLLPALADHPDCAFIEDVAICLPECVILCRPGAESRRGEVAGAADALPADRPRHVIGAPGCIDGGDVLVIGRTVYVGSSSRTNAAGVVQMTGLVTDYGYRLRTMPVDGALHLKTAATALSDEILLVNPDWVDVEAFGPRRCIGAADGEPFAANAMRLGRTVLMQAAAPRTAESVARVTGLDVALIDIGEFSKAEAGLTCLSILVPPARGAP
jgi:dimethylargininase